MADVSLMAVPSQPQDATTCANCGAEVVADQRYCLSCGHPVSPVRLGFLDVLQEQGTHPAPQWSSSGTLEVTPVGYAAEPQSGLGGWIRHNGPIFGLLAVLLLCLIAGLLLGHWASSGGKSGPAVVKVEGLNLGTAAPSASTAPSTSAPAKTSGSSAAAKAKKAQDEAAQGAKETKAEKAPPPPPKKVSSKELQKLSTSTGKKHQEELNAKGAEPIETS